MKRLIEIANDNNVSKQTIYKRLSQLSQALKGHVHKHKHRYLVDRVGQKIISNSISQTANYKRKHKKQIDVNYIRDIVIHYEKIRQDYKNELEDKDAELKEKNHTVNSLLNHVNTQDEEIKQLRKDLQEARKHVSLWETIRNYLNDK